MPGLHVPVRGKKDLAKSGIADVGDRIQILVLREAPRGTTFTLPCNAFILFVVER